MKTVRNGLMMILIFGLIAGGLYEGWNLDFRWRSHRITQHQAEIGKILDGSGWVSPKRSGAKLYLIVHSACAACDAYRQSEFPKLQDAGVDTRVIAVARPDVEGAAKSTPSERATVAELWVNRSWSLYRKWTATPAEAWTAPGIPPADGDVARSAVVEVGRDSLDRLAPLLKDNGINFAYPIVIWWNKSGEMMGCACTRPQTYRFVRPGQGAD